MSDKDFARDLAAIHARIGGSYEADLVPFGKAAHEPLPQPVNESLEGGRGREESAGGYSLAELQVMLGGEEGTVTAPNGAQVPLSIRPWINEGTERFLIRFRFSPRDQAAFNRAVKTLVEESRRDN
jgi:hypothetical protein